MNGKILCLLLLLAAGNAFGDNTAAFMALVQRIMPEAKARITACEVLSDKDFFRLTSLPDGRLLVEGNNANSMAVGLNHYLRYYCLTTVSWYDFDEVVLPDTLPVLAVPVETEARVPARFFLNYCTFGYTMPWWGWPQWERLIDWMALNGVNLPLAITGQESVWLQVWREFGLEDSVIRRYFTGPAHLPWHRMLNIDAWQGGLPQSWLDDQEQLQRRITARERELNMRPVLPAFAGHVPSALTAVYPKAKITRLGAWAGFDERYACSYLDPEDPLFVQIQQSFLRHQTEMYGTNHVYGIDLFNEVDPPSYDTAYLARVARATYDGLKQADPQAVWLQMTWLFYCDRAKWTDERIRAYLTASPRKDNLLLDYYCENTEVWRQTERFHGVPYIWCYLGNFGGNTFLTGDMADIHRRIEGTFAEGGDNFCGIGSTLEGLDCNPPVYEYVFEHAWRIPQTQDTDGWLRLLADRRLGRVSEVHRAAWSRLGRQVYTACARNGQGSLMNMRPAMGKQWKTGFHAYRTDYPNDSLLAVIEELLADTGSTPACRFDIVNLTRQWLGNRFADEYDMYTDAYHRCDTAAMRYRKMRMLAMIDDMDTLLAASPVFLAGKWIADARGKGVTDEEKQYYERNARCLITTWGEQGGGLTDYANRTWNGLCRSFYKERWQRWFDSVEDALSRQETYGGKAYAEAITAFEGQWWNECRDTLPAEPSGDTFRTAARMIERWKQQPD